MIENRDSAGATIRPARTLFRGLPLLCALGCNRAPEVQLDEPRAVSATTSVGVAPMFTVSQNGAEAVAWVSAPGGGTDGRLYISVAEGAPVELRDSLGPVQAHGEAPPKIAYGPDGALNAVYEVGKLVPGQRYPLTALRFTRSTDGGRTWSAPVSVTTDGDFGAHNFHSFYAAPDSTLYASWLDGSTGKSAAFITSSRDGGRTWSAARRASVGEACPCCRTAIAAARNGTVYLAWRNVYAGNLRDIVVARSDDRGQTWSEPVRVHADQWVFDGCPHAGPALQVDAQDRLHVAWWTGRPKAAGVYYARSSDGGRTFGEPVALGIAEFSQPAHAQLGLAGAGTVVAAWDDGTRKSPQVVLRVSRDGGATFGPAQAASAPGRAAGFPVLAVYGERLAVAWSEQSPEAAARENDAMEHAEHDQSAVMGLHAVGDAQVLMRRGTLR
jgi:hypothetical protein